MLSNRFRLGYSSALLLLSFLSHAQDYYFKKFGVQEGLPSEIVKAVYQDSDDYLWIATDEGLARFDGISFELYPEIAHSNYMKGFHGNKEGSFILFGDQDLYEVDTQSSKVEFTPLSPVSRLENDSSISYPKSVYLDHAKNLWVAEAQSVVRLNDEGFKRFNFGIQDRTTQFLRSFEFFEDLSGNLFIISYQGNVFQLDTESDTLLPYSQSLPPEIEYAGLHHEHLIIGAKDGLFAAQLKPEGGFGAPSATKINVPVSYVEHLENGRYFIATRGETHFFSDSTLTNFAELPYQINNINHVLESDESDLWISSNEGLMLVKENLFERVPTPNTFIEAIEEVPGTDKVLYATNYQLFEYQLESKVNNLLLDLPNGYFQDLLHTNQGLWIANAFNVFLYKDGAIETTYDFSYQKRFVKDIALDSKKNIWITITEDEFAHKIDSNLNHITYPIPFAGESIINVIKEHNGNIYLGSSNASGYLYVKPEDKNAFENISRPLDSISQSGFEVTNLAFHKEDIYLATSVGLLKYSQKGIQKIDLGPFSDLPIRSLAEYDLDKLLLSNAMGLILYDINTGLVDHFNENYGLPSRTIAPNGIYIGKDNRIWISTSNGLAFSTKSLRQNRKTKFPKVIEAAINGTKCSSTRDLVVPHGSSLALQVSSITFPQNDVNYQYRLGNSEWKNSAGMITLSDLPSGKAKLEFRAKKYGIYKWSDVNQLAFTVDIPYWKEPLFIFLLLAAILILTLSTYFFVSLFNQKKQLKLQQYIDIKTRELKNANFNLKKLDEEKNNLMQLVAHDLKSPLTQILGLADLMKDDRDFAASEQAYQMITTSVNNLTDMITKILDVRKVESGSLKINLEDVDLAVDVHKVIDRNSIRAKQKNITIEQEIAANSVSRVDPDYVKQVFDNLISNAIKFSPLNSLIQIKLSSNSSETLFEVTDHGPGLSKEDQKKCFMKFQRASARPTANESSTGLGLSIVQKLVVAMNGNVWVESEPGQGASFFVSFPSN